jgi:parallel beta-helix repeat protein
MRTFLFILFILTVVGANAATYYISASSGLDSRTATEAQNASTPWQSLTKVNATTFAAGDKILLKSGDTFYGNLTVNQSGTSGNPIVFGAYGTGAKPLITGLTTITTWTSIGNGRYESTLSSPPTNSLNMVLFNSVLQPVGRYPKAGQGEASYYKIASHTGSSSATSNQISGIPSFVGGELVQHSAEWIIDRATVTAQNSTTVNSTPLPSPDHPSITYESVDGHGFFFQNHPNACTVLGDWSYNKTTKKITMYFGANNPSNYTVRVANKDNLLDLASRNYITVDNIEFKGANESAIRLSASTNCIFNSIDVSFIGINGIAVDYETAQSTSNHAVTNSTFSYINNNGLDLRESTYWTVTGNQIHHIALNAGMGISGDAQYLAIYGIGSNSLAEYNKLYELGYMGIHFVGNNVNIRRNEVYNFMLVKSDGGGIYTFGVTGSNRIVEYNIVHGGHGFLYGLGKDINNPFTHQAQGIYMDGNTTNVVIRYNTSFNNNHAGIWVGSTGEVTINNNTVYNNVRAQIAGIDINRTHTNLNINNNILFSVAKEQLCLELPIRNTYQEIGIFDYNYYCRPINEPQGITTTGYPNAPANVFDNYVGGGINYNSDQNFRSLDTWKAYSGQDAHSVKTPGVALTSTSQIRFELNATAANKTVTLDANYIDAKGAAYSGTITIAPYSSLVLLQQSASTGTTLSNQTITFPGIPSKTYGDAPFAISATASSGLPVTFTVISGPATIAGNTVTLTGTGTVSIQASQAGNTSYNPATAVTQGFTVTKANQTINFPSIPSKTYGDAPFAISATASSGLPVTFTVISGPATIAGNIVTLTGSGTVTIQASQAGNTNYNPATAVSQGFTVNPTAKTNQTITFPGIPSKTYGDAPFAISATASSGLPVTFTVISGPATIAGNIITLTGSGTVTIQASQAGNTNYNPATAVTQGFTVTKANQTINFPSIPSKTYGDAPFAISATASSSLPLTFTVISGPATIAGNIVTLTGSGTVTIQASQAGNTNYNPATAVSQGFTVAKANQTINFPGIPSKTYGDAPFAISATASSGLPVSFTVISGPATISGNTVTLTGSGTVSIQASQAGNANYNAAISVTQSFTVSSAVPAPKADQSIVFPAIPSKTFGNAPFAISATASSGLPVSFTIISGPATIAGNIVTITGAGTVTIQATQPGNTTYNPATAVTQSFTVAKANQAINFQAIPNKSVGDPAFNLNATASSGLPVSFRVVSGPATISGNTVTLTGDNGIVKIEAFQVGNGNYNPALSVSESFLVRRSGNTANNERSDALQSLPFQYAFSTADGSISVYPNPVVSTATIKVSPIEAGETSLGIYDIQGKLVKKLFNGNVETGVAKTINLSSEGLASGIYTVRMASKTKITSKKITIVR